MKVLSFRLAGRLFGIETRYVKEINRNVEYTPVPRASEEIIGLFNMRGQVVTLFDLASILDYRKDLQARRDACIILKAQPNSPDQVGFLIDKTEDVIDIDESLCEPPPANSPQMEYKYVKRVAKLEGELLLLIENEGIFSIHS